MVGNQRNMIMTAAKKQQEPLREMGALAALKASMEREGGVATIERLPETVAPIAEQVTEAVEVEEATPELTREQKAQAKRERDAERKRAKRAAAKAGTATEESNNNDDDVDAALDAHVAEQIAADDLTATGIPTWSTSMVGNYRSQLGISDDVTDKQIFDVLETTRGMNPEDVEATVRAHFDLEEQVEAEVDPTPAEIEPPAVTEAEAAPAPVKQPLDKEAQAKLATITRIVSFYPERIRDEEATMLAVLDGRRLTEIAATLTKHLGEPDSHLSELHQIYLERMKDPAVVAALNAMDKMGGDYDKLISRVARAVGNDVLTNALTGSDFRTAARDAVNTLAVLKKMIIGDLEPVLRRYLDPKSIGTNNPDLPEGLSQLMGVVKHAAAHLDAAVARHKANETYQTELMGRIAQKDRQLEAANEKLAVIERRAAEQFVAIPDMEVFVYCRSSKKFLANHMLPTGRNPDRVKVSILQFHWTSNPAEALRFPDREKALRTVDKMMEASIKLTPKLDPNVAGENIANVGIADAVIRLPTE